MIKIFGALLGVKNEEFKIPHWHSVCCWLDNVYIIIYIIFLATTVAICHIDAIQVFQQDPGITNYKTTLNGICYKILLHTDFFLNGFGLPLVVQGDWFLWSGRALLYHFVRLRWQHDRHGFIWTHCLLDSEQSWTLPCAKHIFSLKENLAVLGSSKRKEREIPGCVPQEGYTGALGEGFPHSRLCLSILCLLFLSRYLSYIFSVKSLKKLLRFMRIVFPLDS